MTYEDFVKNITAPLTAVDYRIINAQSAQECEYFNSLRREVKYTIIRTIRATLQDKEYAERYLKDLTSIIQEKTPTVSQFK